jgi:hypothetical protein
MSDLRSQYRGPRWRAFYGRVSARRSVIAKPMIDPKCAIGFANGRCSGQRRIVPLASYGGQAEIGQKARPMIPSGSHKRGYMVDRKM